MKRTTINFIIDALAFAGFLFLTTTGVLMRYVLPPGSGYHTTIWGLDRHDWGALHFWIAIVFLGALALHLFLHWRWVVCVISGKPREGSGVRLALGLVAALAITAAALAPFGSAVESTRSSGIKQSEASAIIHETHDIRGKTTLLDIEVDMGVPSAYIIKNLGMPDNVSLNVGVAKLGKSYDFTIGDVRKLVEKYQDSQ